MHWHSYCYLETHKYLSLVRFIIFYNIFMMNCKNLVALKGIAKIGKKVFPLLFERKIDFIYRFWNI